MLKSKSKKDNLGNNDLNEDDNSNRHDDNENKMDLDDIVSSFWQENDFKNNVDDGDEMNTRDKNDSKNAFSDDEIVELREIFQSQAINNNITVPVADSDWLDDVPDEFFFVPDINKTIERSRCSDMDDVPGDEINGGILGESPSKNSANLSLLVSSTKQVNSGTEKAENSSLELVKFSSNSTAKSSLEVLPSNSPLEVLPSNSPKPELEETQDIKTRAGSYTSGNSYGSAYADTEPCSETQIKAAISNNPSAFTPKGRKISSDGDSIGQEHIRSKTDNDSPGLDNRSPLHLSPDDVDSTVKSSSKKLEKRKKNSGPLSVITVPNQKEQVLVLDKSNQVKANCEELTIVGSMFFTNDDDYHKFVKKNSPNNTVINLHDTVEERSSLLNKSSSAIMAEERTIVINRDTTTTTSSETEVEEKKNNSSSMNLFHHSVSPVKFFYHFFSYYNDP